MKALVRKSLLLMVDIVLVNIAIYLALVFRFDNNIPQKYIDIFINAAIIVTLFKVFLFYLFGLYKSLWIYASIDEMLQIALAVTAGGLFEFLYRLLLNISLPRSVYAVSWLITLVLIGGFRLSYRVTRRVKNIMVYDNSGHIRAMIIGAGEAGSMVIKEMKRNDNILYKPVVVIDDDSKKHRANIHGVPVVGGRARILETARDFDVNEIIIAMPSAPKQTLSEILNICKETNCKLKTLPGMYELIDNEVDIKKIRDVNIEDLLGREEVNLNTNEISKYLNNEVVLVTGGGGSIGSELCRQIAKYNPRKLLILDIYENNAYDIQNELTLKYRDELNLEVIIASVRDKMRLKDIFEEYKPTIVFHAAAHKHVPLMETNATEAVKNNVFGTLNVVECADKFNVKRFVLISTDKAVNSTSVMGATKRVAEMIVQVANNNSETEYVAVRFGNVLGSNGSVIPLFKKQIVDGGPVTVTHPEVTRFFMTISEAVQLVLQAGAIAHGGEIFILDMGKSVKILDLARDLIKLSGYEPDIDIKIEFTGLRPGEKLFEELLLDEEVQGTAHKNIFVGKPLLVDDKELKYYLKSLENNINDSAALRELIFASFKTALETREQAAVSK